MHYSEPILKTINYINKNLTSDLSLDDLADHMHFSPYHFHRLFLMCTGTAPMEHIRRLRLRAASRDLLSGRANIAEIAMEYRFESQDGFCRAFKKYFGLTPGEYRKLNLKSMKFISQSAEVENRMYDMKLYESLVCSFDEKKEALVVLDKLLGLSRKAKRSGLLSLEAEIEGAEPELMKKSLQLLIDGTEPGALREILWNYTLCSGCKGRELLERILIAEAVPAVQEGINPLLLSEKLSSFFGEEFIGEIDRHFGMDSHVLLFRLESFLNANRYKPALSKDTALLEEPFGRMDERSLQRLLREIDGYTLVCALKGAGGKAMTSVLRNVSKKHAILLIDELEAAENPVLSETADAQRRILEIMQVLEKQGDIVI